MYAVVIHGFSKKNYVKSTCGRTGSKIDNKKDEKFLIPNLARCKVLVQNLTRWKF